MQGRLFRLWASVVRGREYTYLKWDRCNILNSFQKIFLGKENLVNIITLHWKCLHTNYRLNTIFICYEYTWKCVKWLTFNIADCKNYLQNICSVHNDKMHTNVLEFFNLKPKCQMQDWIIIIFLCFSVCKKIFYWEAKFGLAKDFSIYDYWHPTHYLFVILCLVFQVSGAS